jgi:hypothetical protein
MRITVFTSNQPRHISLIESLASIADEVFAVQECTTVFPGLVQDFYKKSEIMQRYFARVIAAEGQVFGRPRFAPGNATQLALKDGDLNRLELSALGRALESDVFVVFGASYIKSPLVDFLVEKRAYNIHMGTSPFYRGSSCNFWAMYDNRADHVGATIHLLSAGLDSGPMLFHTLPRAEESDPFLIGMKAVKAAHAGLVRMIKTGEIFTLAPVPQDKNLQIRYTRNADFTDAVAQEYLERLPTPMEIFQSLSSRSLDRFLRPMMS